MKSQSLKKLLEPLKLNYINTDITDAHFPDDRRRGECTLLHYNESLSSDAVLQRMEKEGYRPATIHEMFTWAKHWNGSDLVAALGSVWADSYGYRYVSCLGELAGGRGVYLHCLDGDWDGRVRFLAVRKVSNTSKLLKDGEIPTDLTVMRRFQELEDRVLELESWKEQVKK